ncbi:hypothetical protein NE659_27970, partial [Flavonifractor plautii]|uniref:hypothetical protein n=1 Tax=Flavonifractor plautii TaxID=292800 RepID=UPI002109D4E4
MTDADAELRGTVDEDPSKGVRYDEKHDNLQRAGPGGLRRLNKVLRHDILHGGFGHLGSGLSSIIIPIAVILVPPIA